MHTPAAMADNGLKHARTRPVTSLIGQLDIQALVWTLYSCAMRSRLAKDDMKTLRYRNVLSNGRSIVIARRLNKRTERSSPQLADFKDGRCTLCDHQTHAHSVRDVHNLGVSRPSRARIRH